MRITESEALYIKRRRLGVNQDARAKDLGVPEWRYVEFEAGRQEPGREVMAKNGRAPKPTDVEECVLRRRRCGKTQAEVAAAIGCSRLWVIRMETGQAKPDRLVEYWRS